MPAIVGSLEWSFRLAIWSLLNRAFDLVRVLILLLHPKWDDRGCGRDRYYIQLSVGQNINLLLARLGCVRFRDLWGASALSQTRSLLLLVSYLIIRLVSSSLHNEWQPG